MGFFLQYAWLIPLFPLLGFAIITLTPIRASKAASGWLAIALMVAATVVALGVGADVLQGVHVAPDGTATVSYLPPSSVFAPYAHTEVKKVAAELDPLFKAIVDRALAAR